jgi:hypothetical protein
MCHRVEPVSRDDPNVILTVDFSIPDPDGLRFLAEQQPHLAGRHRQEMRASGISEEMIAASHIRTVDGAAVCQMLNWSQDGQAVGHGWAIPFDDPESDDCYWRVKLDEARQSDGRVIKYESPLNSSNRAYLPPGFDASKDKTIVITEGEKKSLSAMSHGINCLGLTGVWNWQKPRKRDDSGRAYGSRHLIADLAAIDWRDREVTICFDSDAREKRSIELAQQKLAEALGKQGAKVRVARIPGGKDGSKLGLDDAIVQLGIDAVTDILDAAEEPELPKLNWPDLARMLVADRYSYFGMSTIRHWRPAFWEWNGQHYEEVDDGAIEIAAYRFLAEIGCKVNRTAAREVVTALRAEVNVAAGVEPVSYLETCNEEPPGTPLVFANEIAALDFDRPDRQTSLPTSPNCPGGSRSAPGASATIPMPRAMSGSHSWRAACPIRMPISSSSSGVVICSRGACTITRFWCCTGPCVPASRSSPKPWRASWGWVRPPTAR